MDDEEKQPAWLEMWARRISSPGLSPVVSLLIEIARPFGFLGSQALLMTQPLVTGVAGEETFEQILALLDDPDLLKRLEVCMEEEGLNER
jgi:hypothetical protein